MQGDISKQMMELFTAIYMSIILSHPGYLDMNHKLKQALSRPDFRVEML
jgi:hypothetical protein